MGVLRQIFGPSKEEVWHELCNQIGAEYVDGGFWNTSKVVAHVKNWSVTLDTYIVSTGKSSVTYTRMRAPYVNPDGFRFKIYREGLFSGLGKLLGMQDICIGDDDFDKAFVIKGNDENKVISLFSDTRIRELVDMQPYISLEVKDDEGTFKKSFPEGVDELYFCVTGVIKDVDRLRELYELFSEVLNRLCIMGSAYEDAPNVELK